MLAHLFLASSLSLIGCVTRSRDPSLSGKPNEQAAAPAQTSQTKANDQQSAASPQINSGIPGEKGSPRINLNTASARELEKLPGIGRALAARIIEHREKYGPFRRPEHLIIVRGISDRRFRALRDLITVE